MNLLLSMKINHVQLSIVKLMTNMYKTIMRDKCLSDSKIIDNMLAIARMDPRNFGYIFFKEFGTLAILFQIVSTNCLFRTTMFQWHLKAES